MGRKLLPAVYWASYKGTHPGLPGLVNRGIRHADSSIYSHSEICIGNPFERPVPCLSSSGVDKGVRSKTMQLSREKWDVLYLPWGRADRCLVRFGEIEGEGYDYTGCFRFAAPAIFPVRQHPTRWFCTEACLYFIEAAPDQEWRLSPATGHLLMLEKGGLLV